MEKNGNQGKRNPGQVLYFNSSQNQAPVIQAPDELGSKIDGFFYLSRQMEAALNQERENRKKLQAYIQTIKTKYEELRTQANSRTQKLSYEARRFKESLDQQNLQNRNLQAESQNQKERLMEVQKHVKSYRDAWEALKNRDKENKEILSKREKEHQQMLKATFEKMKEKESNMSILHQREIQNMIKQNEAEKEEIAFELLKKEEENRTFYEKKNHELIREFEKRDEARQARQKEQLQAIVKRWESDKEKQAENHRRQISNLLKETRLHQDHLLAHQEKQIRAMIDTREKKLVKTLQSHIHWQEKQIQKIFSRYQEMESEFQKALSKNTDTSKLQQQLADIQRKQETEYHYHRSSLGNLKASLEEQQQHMEDIRSDLQSLQISEQEFRRIRKTVNCFEAESTTEIQNEIQNELYPVPVKGPETDV
jgi:prefoldin subunit 5